MPLRADKISKNAKGKWALRDVSFEAADGEVTGIFGPAAAERTSLARILAGLDKPDRGRVMTTSADPLVQDASTEDVRFLSRESEKGLIGLFRNILRGDSRGSGEVLSRVDALASTDARVLILDDPFCGHTWDERESAERCLRNAAQGRVVILTAASFEDVLGSCDKAALLVDGEVLQFGTPAELYLRPSNVRVARSTGRCNIFGSRRLSSSKAKIPEFQTLKGSHRLTAGTIEKVRLGALNQDINLAIRPEHVSISFGASFPEDNLLKAVVTAVKFLGSTTLVRLNAGGLEVDALVMRLVGLNPGDECMIGMPPDRIMILAD